MFRVERGRGRDQTGATAFSQDLGALPELLAALVLDEAGSRDRGHASRSDLRAEPFEDDHGSESAHARRARALRRPITDPRRPNRAPATDNATVPSAQGARKGRI